MTHDEPGEHAARIPRLPARSRRERSGAVPDRAVVLVSLEAWDQVWRRNQYLVAELLRADPELRVVFVEPAYDPLHAIRRGDRSRHGRGLLLGRGLRAGPAVDGVAPDRLWRFEPTKWLPRKIDPHVDRRSARAVRRVARRLGFAAPVLWVNDPSAATLVAQSGWPALYDITDDWLAADRTPDEHRRLVADEALLLERCDEVTVCSDHLARSKLTTRTMTLITNGVDLDRYRAIRARPGDLPDGPTAVYVGTVHPDRFDVAAARATARALGPSGSVVIVGPVIDLTRDSYRAMLDDGVVILGPRAWDEVPAYLQHADVLLVPHLVNEFTESLDPIKLYEYRAVRRPVVATPVAGFRDGGDPRVTVVDATAFPEAVARALDAATRRSHPETVGVAAADLPIPTWRDQAALMRTVIDRVRLRAATPR